MTSEKSQLCLGLFVLLLVDIIWVASSELSEYIFKDTGFNKPFFSTYLKTSLFSIYLLGFIVWPPWRHHCSYREDGRYSRLNREDVEEEEEISQLSSPQYEPVKMSEESKENDTEAEATKSGNKSVRFNDVAEVRQLPESDGVEALMSRLSFSATLRAQQQLYNMRAALPVRRVMEVAMYFCLLWFIGNYSYQMALSFSHTGVVNVVSSTSGLFTLILAAIFPSAATDSFTLSKFLTVLLMLAGVTMVSIEDMRQSHSSNVSSEDTMLQSPLYHHTIQTREISLNNSNVSHLPSVYKTFMGSVESVMPTVLSTVQSNSSHFVSRVTEGPDYAVGLSGVLWALCGALSYACYMVFLRRKVKHEEEIDVPMFFGFVGLFNTLLLWPFLLILHLVGWEVLVLPSQHQLLYILINGLVGTVLSELLWIWGCFLTSSLLATLSLSLTIPLSMLCDVLLRGVSYSWLFYAGTLPILAAFGAISLITHYDNWDPLGAVCCCCGKEAIPPHSDTESESLIVSGGDYDDEGDEDNTTLSVSCDDSMEINDYITEMEAEQDDLIDISPASDGPLPIDELKREAAKRELFRAEVISALEPPALPTQSQRLPSATSEELMGLLSMQGKVPQSNNISAHLWSASDHLPATSVNKQSKDILNINTKHLQKQKMQIQFNNLLSDHVKQDLLPLHQLQESSALMPLNNLPILDIKKINAGQTNRDDAKYLLDCTKLNLMSNANSGMVNSESYLQEEDETLQIIKHEDSELITSHLVTSNLV